jgi:hypothetical protein
MHKTLPLTSKTICIRLFEITMSGTFECIAAWWVKTINGEFTVDEILDV